MRYILLIYSDESGIDQVTPEQWAETMQAYNTFTANLQKSGAMLAGEALHPTRAATTVRVRNDKTMITDGPFAETKEALGGYYVVEAKDLDAAIEWAKQIPGSMFGSIEVRPVMEFEQ